MKAKDLIKILKQLDPETVVVLSSDSEGNSFSKLADSQEFLWDESENEICNFEDFEDEHNLERAIVLWP